MPVLWPALGAGVLLIAFSIVFLRPDLKTWRGSGPTIRNRLQASAFGVCLVLGALLVAGSFVGFDLS